MAVSSPPPAISPSPLPPPHKYDSWFGRVRHALFGKPLATAQHGEQKLRKLLALPIFSSDALSSNAYATEAILGVLLVKGSGALHVSWPVALAIAALLAIVVASYSQVIRAYPDGGGAYPVSRDNLGTGAALVAGASLLVDYILTVAVSVAAGVAALVTMGNDPVVHGFLARHGAAADLQGHLVGVCVAATLFLTLANLRGVRETGGIFALPTYAFILSLLLTIGFGLFEYATGATQIAANLTLGRANEAAASSVNWGGLAGIYLILQAFSSGCTALTGVEAISNTTPLFQRPESTNAVKTLAAMAVLSIVMFLGLTWLTRIYGLSPMDATKPGYESIVGLVADKTWPPALHWMFYAVQISTALVLILAANTAFAGFPQLASMLARDSFLPRQLANLGDRLAFSNGIIILAIFACLLLAIFHGVVDDLLPLYAIGVFTSFTLAQAGMVQRWRKTRERGWQGRLTVNLLGAVVTGIVAVIIAVSKWESGLPINQSFHIGTLTPHYGAWLVVVLIPLLVAIFGKINRHYKEMAEELSLDSYTRTPFSRNVVLVLVPRLHRGIVEALDYAQNLSDDVRAIYVETNPATTPGLKNQWDNWAGDIPLLILESPYRSLIGPMLRYIEAVQKERDDDIVTVIVPELASAKWWHWILHNQTAPILKLALLGRRDVVVTNVRYFLKQ